MIEEFKPKPEVRREKSVRERGGKRGNGEPWPWSPEEHLTVLPLSKVPAEVGPGGLGSVDGLVGRLGVVDHLSGVEEGVDVGGGLCSTRGDEMSVLEPERERWGKGENEEKTNLLDVALNVHGEARSLGEGKTEVEGDGTGNGTQTNEEAPAEVEVAVSSKKSVTGFRLSRRRDEGHTERRSRGRSGSMTWRPWGRRWKRARLRTDLRGRRSGELDC
jgi:hypothetical protein